METKSRFLDPKLDAAISFPNLNDSTGCRKSLGFIYKKDGGIASNDFCDHADECLYSVARLLYRQSSTMELNGFFVNSSFL